MARQGIEIARLDHLGIVAGLCREIGIAEYLDTRDEHTHERVSGGTATVAMLLNGLGFANRRLYLVSQFFKTKPVEHLLGAGITAEDLQRRVPGTHPRLALYPRCDRAVCRSGGASAPAPGVLCARTACGHDLVCGQWGLCPGRGRRPRRPSHRHHQWVFARSSPRPQAMDAGVGHQWGGGHPGIAPSPGRECERPTGVRADHRGVGDAAAGGRR